MKTISIVVACYNEEGNIEKLAARIRDIFRESLPEYNYQLLFIDNESKDRTRELIEKLCQEDPAHVCGILNSRNVGSIRSSVYGMLQATGDCVVKMCADFQDPPEMLVDFVKYWEEGYRLVLAIKKDTEERAIMKLFRGIYYGLLRKITEIKHIDNFVGFGLYDREFIEVIREAKDPMPYLRGMVAELGFSYKPVYYVQPPRASGKSSFNFYRLYDYAMLGITTYSRVPLRAATFIGAIGFGLSALLMIIGAIAGLVSGGFLHMGYFFLIMTILLIGFMQTFFIGLIGEYLIYVNIRVINRPMVVEEKRINLPKPGDSGKDESSRL